jgi:hypothetical protein
MYYKKSIRNNETTITITSYITNDGISDSGEIKIKLFIEDSNGLSHSEAEKTIGSISAHKTEEILLNVVVIDSERYNVDTILFEDGQRVISSGGYFRTPATSEPYQSTGGTFDMEEGESDQKDFSTPGFEALELIIIILIILIFISIRRRKRIDS